MTIGGRFLPKSVNLRLTAIFDHPREACGFDFEQFHSGSLADAHSPRRAGFGRALPSNKSARELRQGGSDYRCCIPALAGFVSPQSIAPDGEQIFSQESRCATAELETFDEKIAACPWRLNTLRERVFGVPPSSGNHRTCAAAQTRNSEQACLLTKRQIRFYARYIGTVDACGFTQPAFTLWIFR